MNGLQNAASMRDHSVLEGAELCLKFANTVHFRTSLVPTDSLQRYAHLVTWSVDAGILAADVAMRLLAHAEAHPATAANVLLRARTLRELIYRMYSAIARGEAPLDGDLAYLNAVLESVLGHARVALAGHGFAWAWSGEEALDRMLWPVAHATANLLTSSVVHAVRECAGSGCGWLFVDTSRNGSRRWCSMQSCGNRAKARRHYARTHPLSK